MLAESAGSAARFMTQPDGPRVGAIADWQGLKEADLYERRELRPTADLRTVLKGVLRDHLRIPDTALATTVFPDSAGAKPVLGLITA